MRRRKFAVCLMVSIALSGLAADAWAGEICVVNLAAKDVEVLSDYPLAGAIEAQAVTLNASGQEALCKSVSIAGETQRVSFRILYKQNEVDVLVCDPTVGPLEVVVPWSGQASIDSVSCGFFAGFPGATMDDLYVNSVNKGDDGVYRIFITDKN